MLSSPLFTIVAAGMSMTEVWAKASFIVKFICVLMLIMGLISLYVAIERWVSFKKSSEASQALGAELNEAFQKGDLKAALDACNKPEYESSYLGKVLAPGLIEVQDGVTQASISASERAIERQSIQEDASLKKGMTILATTGATAPFVGLVGTVFGIIHTMGGLGEGDLTAIVGEIGEALYATAIGIAVAIVAVWLYNYFNGRLDTIRRDIRISVHEFNDWCLRKLT